MKTIKNILRLLAPSFLIRQYQLLRSERKKRQLLRLPIHNIQPSGDGIKFIVTLTSYGTRLLNTTPYAIMTLLQQSVQPDRIVLWLTNGTTIPDPLKELMQYGLEIKFCDEMRSYKKLIPSLIEFPNDVLITADDDLYYPFDWFEKMKTAYFSDPSKIYCHRVHEICFDENNNLKPYIDWRFAIKKTQNTHRIFPTNGSGTIYPPKSFNSIVLNRDEFTELAPFADDIWFWAMAKLKHKEYAIIKGGYTVPFPIDPINESQGLADTNLGEGGNDKQLKAVLNRFPEILNSL